MEPHAGAEGHIRGRRGGREGGRDLLRYTPRAWVPHLLLRTPGYSPRLLPQGQLNEGHHTMGAAGQPGHQGAEKRGGGGWRRRGVRQLEATNPPPPGRQLLGNFKQTEPPPAAVAPFSVRDGLTPFGPPHYIKVTGPRVYLGVGAQRGGGGGQGGGGCERGEALQRGGSHGGGRGRCSGGRRSSQKSPPQQAWPTLTSPCNGLALVPGVMECPAPNLAIVAGNAAADVADGVRVGLDAGARVVSDHANLALAAGATAEIELNAVLLLGTSLTCGRGEGGGHLHREDEREEAASRRSQSPSGCLTVPWGRGVPEDSRAPQTTQQQYHRAGCHREGSTMTVECGGWGPGQGCA